MRYGGACAGLMGSPSLHDRNNINVCALHRKEIFPPVHIQPNQCPCRCLLLIERRALSSQPARQGYTLQIFTARCFGIAMPTVSIAVPSTPPTINQTIFMRPLLDIPLYHGVLLWCGTLYHGIANSPGVLTQKCIVQLLSLIY